MLGYDTCCENYIIQSMDYLESDNLFVLYCQKDMDLRLLVFYESLYNYEKISSYFLNKTIDAIYCSKEGHYNLIFADGDMFGIYAKKYDFFTD